MEKFILKCYNIILMAKTKKKSVTKKDVSRSSVDFQKEFTKLEKISEEFEAGKYNLQTGLKKFEEGLQIAKALKQHLEEIDNTIEVIKGKYDDFTQEN